MIFSLRQWRWRQRAKMYHGQLYFEYQEAVLRFVQGHQYFSARNRFIEDCVRIAKKHGAKDKPPTYKPPSREDSK